MSAAARTVYVFGIYLVVVGVIATAVPNVLLGVLGIPATDEPWIRLLGIVLLLLAYYYFVAARADLTALHRATVPGRVAVGVGDIILVVLWGYWPALVFGLVDLAGAAWTAKAMRADAGAPRSASAGPKAGLYVVVLLGLAGLAVVAAPTPAGAAECPDGAVSWSGSPGQNWFTPGNWSDGAVPTAATAVCIDSASTITIDGADAVAASVTTHADAVLRVRASGGADGTLTTGGDVHNGGRIELGSVSSGTVAGHLEVGGTPAQQRHAGRHDHLWIAVVGDGRGDRQLGCHHRGA